MIHIQNSHRQLRWSMPQAYPNRIDWRVHSSGPCCHWSPECHTTEGTPSDRLCRYGFGPGVWRWHWGPTRDCWHSAGLHRVGRLHEENPDIIPIHVNNCQWNPQQRRGQPSHIADKQLMYHILLYHWYHLQIHSNDCTHPPTKILWTGFLNWPYTTFLHTVASSFGGSQLGQPPPNKYAKLRGRGIIVTLSPFC